MEFMRIDFKCPECEGTSLHQHEPDVRMVREATVIDLDNQGVICDRSWSQTDGLQKWVCGKCGHVVATSVENLIKELKIVRETT